MVKIHNESFGLVPQQTKYIHYICTVTLPCCSLCEQGGWPLGIALKVMTVWLPDTDLLCFTLIVTG